MKEIKFEGINLKTGERRIWRPTIHQDEVFRQFTGLTNKDGVDVYEGDLLVDSKGLLWRMDWHEQQHGFMLYDFGRTPEHEIYHTDEAWEELKVIGNIYGNPALIP